MKMLSFIKMASITCLTALALITTGCGKVTKNLNNHSLAYTKTQKLAPIQVPVSLQTQPFTPLYTVPEAGVNTLKIQNAKGKRFVLPKPYNTAK